MDEPETKQSFEMNANDSFLAELSHYFSLSRTGFVECKHDMRYLFDIQDCLEQIYISLKPYCTEEKGKDLAVKFKEMKNGMIDFSRGFEAADQIQGNTPNFWQTRAKLLSFFSELTTLAVDLQFFPKRQEKKRCLK